MSPGPPPKRSEERRRRNKPVIETTKVDLTEKTSGEEVDIPDPGEHWHEIAHLWYESLLESGQARYYEPSDWATAFLIAEHMSRELKPKPMLVEAEDPETGETIMVNRMIHLPIPGGSLTAMLRAMSSLMTTEGERRRLQMELTRPAPTGEQGENVVSITKNRQEALGG